MSRKHHAPETPEERRERIERTLRTWPIAAWTWPKIAIAIGMERALGHADDVFYDFWEIAAQGTPIIRMPYGRTDLVRNKVALALLESDYTHILYLDVDHKHPPNILQSLARWVLADPERLVVGGLNFRRGEPYDACAYKLGSGDGRVYPIVEWERGLIEVDAIGTGSLLVSRKVFERIEPPWFANDYSRVMWDEWPGEDLWFCRLCREAGIKMYCDTTVTSPHMIDATVDETVFRAFLADHSGTIMSIDEFEEAQRAQSSAS